MPLAVKWLVQSQQKQIIKSKMTYSELESESDFSFVINSVADFTLLLNLGITLNLALNMNLILVQRLWIYTSVFSLSDICILLNKLVDGFFINFHNRINNYASNASIMHIFFWYIITQKVCFYYTIKFSYFSF